MNRYQKQHLFFATCPRGIEEILHQEITSLGAQWAKQTRAGVEFKGNLKTAYRICLWSRVANRVLLPLGSFDAKTPDDLYSGTVTTIDWDHHIRTAQTFAVDFTADHNNTFHSHFAALRVKDAIVDQLRSRFGDRPDIDTENPDIRIQAHMKKDQAQISLDLSGESLHKRGYRINGGTAPLKENLAAAILIRAQWPQIAAEGAPLLDPLCGSGTLVIEGALMALDRAPGLLRPGFGFLGWQQHDVSAWRELLDEAQLRAQKGMTRRNQHFSGCDADHLVISQARANAERAGISRFVSFSVQDMKTIAPSETQTPGLLLTNPPYGMRLGNQSQVEALYRLLGNRIKKEFKGWRAGVFTAHTDLGAALGVRFKKQYRLYNGPIPCRLFCFDIHEKTDAEKKTVSPDPGGEMFRNRIRKNLRTIGKWAQKEGITCYRLYDADMPEYAVAIDVYHNYLHVQEYLAPASVHPEKARKRLRQIMAVLPDTLKIPADRIVLKVRERKKGRDQYERFNKEGRFLQVRENALRFQVNLTDYLDTGLFLDQRLLRMRIRKNASGKRFLNLFCYTGAATVYAAAGGAAVTTSVDLSNTYLSWARTNLALNGFEEKKHTLVQSDCLTWIAQSKNQYDLIYLDPPTFSNSKRMKTSFDVQRDHESLLQSVLRLLSPGGTLFFSCNRRKFKFKKDSFRKWNIIDITKETIPLDFQRRPNMHHTFEIK